VHRYDDRLENASSAPRQLTDLLACVVVRRKGGRQARVTSSDESSRHPGAAQNRGRCAIWSNRYQLFSRVRAYSPRIVGACWQRERATACRTWYGRCVPRLMTAQACEAALWQRARRRSDAVVSLPELDRMVAASST